LTLPFSFDLQPSTCNLTQIYKVFVDGVEGVPPWMTFDEALPSYTINTIDPAHEGIYQVKIEASLNTVPATQASGSIDFQVALSPFKCLLTEFNDHPVDDMHFFIRANEPATI